MSRSGRTLVPPGPKSKDSARFQRAALKRGNAGPTSWWRSNVSVGIAIGIAVIVVLVGEIGVRVAGVTPSPRTRSEVERKIAAFSRSDEPATIVLGHSVADSAIDPSRFDPKLGRVLNASISGLSYLDFGNAAKRMTNAFNVRRTIIVVSDNIVVQSPIESVLDSRAGVTEHLRNELFNDSESNFAAAGWGALSDAVGDHSALIGFGRRIAEHDTQAFWGYEGQAQPVDRLRDVQSRNDGMATSFQSAGGSVIDSQLTSFVRAPRRPMPAWTSVVDSVESKTSPPVAIAVMPSDAAVAVDPAEAKARVKLIDDFGKKRGLPVFDLTGALVGKKPGEMFNDFVHESAAGAAQISSVLSSEIVSTCANEPEIDWCGA